MKHHYFLSFFFIFLAAAIGGQGVMAQSDCEKALITAENLYQSGQLYDVPDKLIPCLGSGFNRQEKQNAYRLLTLTYLNINQEEEAKNTLHKLLRLNPDYIITKEKDPVELYNLYRQFHVDPVFYTGIRAGVNLTRPFTIQERSSSSLAIASDKSFTPYYGFSIGGDFVLPLYKKLLIEFSPAYASNTYRFQSLYFTDAFSETAPMPQVQEVSGRETYHTINLPLTLSLRIPVKGSKLKYNLGAGMGTSFLLASAYKDLNRINRQIFTEEINVASVATTPFRRNINFSAHLEAGVEYKYLGYFWGVRAGISSTLRNYAQYNNEQEMFLNTMSTNFGWLDDDFVLNNGYFSFFVRKPLYKFL